MIFTASKCWFSILQQISAGKSTQHHQVQVRTDTFVSFFKTIMPFLASKWDHVSHDLRGEDLENIIKR